MSNTYIEPGTADPDAVLADVRSGIYVTRLRGGDVDIVTGEFAFSAAEAYQIEAGKLTRPLSGVTLLGNGPAALSAVDAVASILRSPKRCAASTVSGFRSRTGLPRCVSPA
jgi:TldD protein